MNRKIGARERGFAGDSAEQVRLYHSMKGKRKAMDTPKIDRREMLKLGALALGGTAMVKPDLDGLTRKAQAQGTGNQFVPVDVATDRIIRKYAGVRPFRPSGFVVRSQALGDKTVVHNYGHGGCGVSLSWGTASLALAEALKTSVREAAVLGSGAVGLATARLLQDHGFQVTIYARELPPNTTSNVAGAMFGAVTLVDPDKATPEFIAQLQQAVRFSHRYFQTLVGERYNVRWVPTFYIGDYPPEPTYEQSLTPEISPIVTLTPEENPFPTKYAGRFYTMMINTDAYLPAVLSDFLLRGGKLVVQDFEDLDAVAALPEALVMNCTGFGAKELFGDEELEPIKGQLMQLVPQHEVKYAFINGPAGLYMFPRDDGIVLGGSEEEGVDNTEPTDAVEDHIFNGHKAFFEQMKS